MLKAARGGRPKAKGPLCWPVEWVRIMGEEFIAEVKTLKDGIMLKDPCVLTGDDHGNMLLGLYGNLSEEKTLFVKNEHVLHHSKSTAQVEELYRLTLKNTANDARQIFEMFMQRSINNIRSVSEPSSGPPSDILEKIKQAFGPDADVRMLDPNQDIRAQLQTGNRKASEDSVDNLIRLADSMGKGKPKSVKD